MINLEPEGRGVYHAIMVNFSDVRGQGLYICYIHHISRGSYDIAML